MKTALILILVCVWVGVWASLAIESTSYALNTTIAANTPLSYTATCSSGSVRVCNPVLAPQSIATPTNPAFVPMTYAMAGAVCTANMTQPVEIAAGLYKVLISIGCVV